MIRWRNTVAGMTAPSPPIPAAALAPGTAGVRRLLVGRTAAALATSLIPTTLTLAVVHAGSATGSLGLT